MVDLRTPGLVLATWLFGCQACQKPWLSRLHLKGTKWEGAESDRVDSRSPTTVLRRGRGADSALGNHLPPRAPRQKPSARNPSQEGKRSTRWPEPALGVEKEEQTFTMREIDDYFLRCPQQDCTPH